MLNFCDHAADRGRVVQLGDPADLVELEADQRRTLRVVAPYRAAGLLDLDHLCGLGHCQKLRKSLVRDDLVRKTGAGSCRSSPLVYSATTSASPPTRRACSVDTLILRRAATERGES